MLNQLFRRIAAALIGAAIAAMAAAIAAVAGAFALYGLLRIWFTPAGAAALDGLAFALVAALTALILPVLFRRKRRPDTGGRNESGAAKLASDTLVALLTAGLEMVRSRRGAPRDAPGKVRRERRRG
jgi:membrane protein implicated in regulation of membrane protease activity